MEESDVSGSTQRSKEEAAAAKAAAAQAEAAQAAAPRFEREAPGLRGRVGQVPDEGHAARAAPAGRRASAAPA